MQTHDTALDQTQTVLPKVSLAQEWRNALNPWWKAALAILPTFLITRLVLLLLTYFGGVLFSVPNYSSFSLTFNGVLYSWYHWDVPRYLAIATKGYPEPGYAAYFPLYPALVHIMTALSHRDILLVGMLISNLAFFGALIVLYRFVELEFDAETARRSVLYSAIFPMAFLFFASTAEAVYFLLLLLCFYNLRHGSWWLAGLMGGLAALTHITGFLLIILFLCEFIRQRLAGCLQAWREKHTSFLLALLVPLVAAMLIPLGTAIYGYALNKQFADNLAFFHPQGRDNPSLMVPWKAPLTLLQNVFHTPFYSFTGTHSIAELVTFLFFLTLLVLCFVGRERFGRQQWTLGLFLAIMLIFALIFPGFPGVVPGSADPFPAISYLSPLLFPGFIVLAQLGKRSWLHQSYLLLSLPLLAFIVLQLLTNRWMM